MTLIIRIVIIFCVIPLIWSAVPPVAALGWLIVSILLGGVPFAVAYPFFLIVFGAMATSLSVLVLIAAWNLKWSNMGD